MRANGLMAGISLFGTMRLATVKKGLDYASYDVLYFRLLTRLEHNTASVY